MSDEPIPFDESNKPINWEVKHGERPEPSFDYVLPFEKTRRAKWPVPEFPPPPIKSDRLYERQVKMRLNPDRFYLRGTSWLGLLNTVLGALFNRVLCRHLDENTLKTVGWSIGKATDFPPKHS